MALERASRCIRVRQGQPVSYRVDAVSRSCVCRREAAAQELHDVGLERTFSSAVVIMYNVSPLVLDSFEWSAVRLARKTSKAGGNLAER